MAFPHHPQMWGLPSFFLEFVEGELPEGSVPEVARGSEVGTHWGASLRLRVPCSSASEGSILPFLCSFCWWPFMPIMAARSFSTS